MMLEERRAEARLLLMEEIVQIHYKVAILGMPESSKERSLLARYGKLILVAEHLLDVLTDDEDASPHHRRSGGRHAHSRRANHTVGSGSGV